jgi:hypothetical protein
VYLILALIDLLSFSPIICPENVDYVVAIREPESKNSVVHKAEAIVPLLIRTVRKILGYHALRVGESELCGLKA